MFRNLRTVLIIPALDEEETIGNLVERVPRPVVDEVIVVDNGSSDATAQRARAAGARVLHEPRRGYGSACLTAIREAGDADIFVFLDGDGSDDPLEIVNLLEALERQKVDLVIGSRVLGDAEKGSLTPIQRFGNALTCSLVRLLWGAVYTDLGPFRAIRASALRRLAMRDPDFGWTIEMQVKAVQRGMRFAEVPVSHRHRAAGKSKVSGTVAGSARAGARILGYLFEAKAQELFGRRGKRRAEEGELLIVFTRYPEIGKVKTRLLPALGEPRATALHRWMVAKTCEVARSVIARRGIDLMVWYTGGTRDAMASWLGSDLHYEDQGDGDLGRRLHRAFEAAFAQARRRVIAIGTDCPELSDERIEEAFERLAEFDLVLGPAADGGYYLIGMSRFSPELFDAIPWGGTDVCAQTERIADRLGLTVSKLGLLHDVDRPEDLMRVSAILPEEMRTGRLETD